MKKVIRRLVVLLLTAVLSVSAVKFDVHAEGAYEGPDIFAHTYCVINGDTGEVLMSKNKDERMFPASTTKILTALIVLENVEDLSQELTFTHSAVDIDPSSSTLDPKAMEGETMTVKDALYGMLLKSANECGAMLGEFVGGSEEKFAEMMNEKAAEIGAVNSHFMNAYGIHHEEHYTTAYDLCLILKAAMENERYRELNGTKEYTISETNLCTSRTFPIGHQMMNGMFETESEGVIGGKTGSTPQAGRVLTTATDRDGLYTISVLMGSDTENQYSDEAVLQEFTYGFLKKEIAPVEWVPVGDKVTVTENVRVRYSPSVNAGVAGMLEAGEELERKAVYGDWSMVTYEDRDCCVASQYLNSNEPEKVPETTAYEWLENIEERETIGVEILESSETEQESSADNKDETTVSETDEKQRENKADFKGFIEYIAEESGLNRLAGKLGMSSKTVLLCAAGALILLICISVIMVRIAKKHRKNNY